jgi:hypothetical protein
LVSKHWEDFIAWRTNEENMPFSELNIAFENIFTLSFILINFKNSVDKRFKKRDSFLTPLRG